MTNDVSSLDSFIASPTQRDFTRTLRLLLYGTGYEHVLVYGDPEATTELLQTLVQYYPVENELAFGVFRQAKKIISNGSESRELPADVSVASMIASFTRQDPDVIAVSVEDLDSDAASAVLRIGLIGTSRLMLASGAPTLEAAIAELRERTSVDTKDLPFSARVAIKVQTTQSGVYRIEEILYRPLSTSEWSVVASLDEQGTVVIERDRLPDVPVFTSPLHTPVLRPPLESWPAPRVDPRAAYLPVVAAQAEGRQRIGGREAWRPAGELWPVCASCGLPLVLLVQLDLGQLPPLPFAARGIAQVFVCNREGSCDTYCESDPGVRAEILTTEALEVVHAPPTLVDPTTEPGSIIAWRGFSEDPAFHDYPKNIDGHSATEEKNLAGAHHCDKLGGWPAWQQEPDWPINSDGTNMHLLWQIAEADLREGGSSEGWDFETARVVPADNGRLIIDPNHPNHYCGIWSGDAVALVFIDNTGTKLAFRVQMT